MEEPNPKNLSPITFKLACFGMTWQKDAQETSGTAQAGIRGQPNRKPQKSDSFNLFEFRCILAKRKGGSPRNERDTKKNYTPSACQEIDC